MALTPVGHRLHPSLLYAAGLAAVYTGERVLSAGTSSTVATLLGLLLLLASLGARVLVLARRPADRPSARPLLLLQGLGVLALALYFLEATLTFRLTGKTFEQHCPRLSGVVAALWPALLLAGTLPVLFAEMSLDAMKRAPVREHGRVRAATLSGLGIGFALVFCFTAAYVSSERDVKADLSYFRTARAGEATRKLVRALDKPVRVTLFFPPANEVFEEIDSYFKDLVKESKHIVLDRYDHAVHPAKARDLGVSGNGIVVIARDSLREQIAIPLVLESARTQLRVLDQEVHKRIIGVSKGNRIAYFTQGHEERTFDPQGETDRRPTVRRLKDLLTDLGFEPRELGVAQGLATDVPNDAQVVLIVGPRRPLLAEETQALLRYLDRKGRLLVALDPDAGETLDQLLAALQLQFSTTTVANDAVYVPVANQPSDRANVVTGKFSSHASVSTVGRLGMRAPVIMLGAGSLAKRDQAPSGIVNRDFTIHAEPSTWNDKNGNFLFDQQVEARRAYELGAAATRRNPSAIAPEDEARAVVLADSDGLADFVLPRSLGNIYLARDAIRWLAGDEAITGVVNTEEDVPVTHTRKQDVAWFYTSVFAAPALVLGLGFVTTRRRRPRPQRDAGAPRAGKPVGEAAPPPEASP